MAAQPTSVCPVGIKDDHQAAVPWGSGQAFRTKAGEPVELDDGGRAIDDVQSAVAACSLVRDVHPMERAVLEIDGAAFDDFEGFCSEVTTKLFPAYDGGWHGNLDAFNDLLRGGFGTPDGGFVIRWVRAKRSRTSLGYGATARRLEQLLTTCHPSNIAHLRERLRLAQRGEGPTLFDEIVEVIRMHGPGGEEAEDGVDLVLVEE
jgi:hypothetical protein